MRAVLVAAVGCALGSWALSACRTADVAPPDVYVDYDQRARLPDGGAPDAVTTDAQSSDVVTTDAQSSDVVTTDAVTTDAQSSDAVSSDVSTPDVSVDVFSDASADTSSVPDAGPGDGATD